ncbi:MAG: CoxG family protein [Candidatus Binatia bacterium]
MQVEYSHYLPYPRKQVWDVLLDTECLARVLPGVEKFEPIGEDRFAVLIKLGVPTVKGMYSGTVEIVDKQFPNSYRLRGEGKGAPGWAKGEALMTLVDEGAGTRVNAKGSAQVGGTIAGVGQRMMEGVTKAMLRELFESFEREMQGGANKPHKPVGAATFGFRMVLGMVRAFLQRLFGRGETAPR